MSPYLFNGQRLSRVAFFKFFEHLVTDDLRDSADIERERRALAMRANMKACRLTAQAKIHYSKLTVVVVYLRFME